MKKRKLKRNELILTMKVFPLHAYPDEPFYRYIEMPSLASLYDLAETIIDSIGFDFDHPFGFYSDLKKPFKSVTGYELFADSGEKGKYPGVKKAIIEDVFPGTGYAMLFYFDYGDGWQFPVQVWGARMADEEDAGKTFPILVKSAGEAPEQYPDYDETDEEDDEGHF
jgi:hypothetical protein